MSGYKNGIDRNQITMSSLDKPGDGRLLRNQMFK